MIRSFRFRFSTITVIAAVAASIGCGEDDDAGPAEPSGATQLAFTVQPSAALAGATITPAIQVVARDAQGNTVASYSGNVTVAIGTNPAGGVLGGTKTVAAISGVATFSGLTIDKAGTAYTLTASASGLSSATSASFNITAAAAGTTLYLSPMLNFRLNVTPTVRTSAVELCVSTTDWTATLAGDMVGTSYTFNLGVKTANSSSGTGQFRAQIIHKRGATETVLATTTFSTTSTYGVQTATVTGPDPATQAGDILILRVSVLQPSAGVPCVAEFSGPGTDNRIVVPQTTVQ